MRFGVILYLIEFCIKNIFLEKSYIKYDGKIFPDPSLKNQN